MIARSTDRCAINGSIDGAAQSMDRANPSIARNIAISHSYRDISLISRYIAIYTISATDHIAAALGGTVHGILIRVVY